MARFILGVGEGGSERWLNVDYIKLFGHNGTGTSWQLSAFGDFGVEGSYFTLPGTYPSQPDAQLALQRLLQGIDPSVYA